MFVWIINSFLYNVTTRLYKGEDNLIHERYADNLKLVVDANELKLIDETQVLIYFGDKRYNEVTVDLEEEVSKFEELRPYIIFIAKNLCTMDCIAQKYSGDSKFAYMYEVAYICFDVLDIISLRYYGMNENTEFDVVFQYLNGDFILKSFGMVKNIPLNWDKK